MIPLPELGLFHNGIMMEINFENQISILASLLRQYHSIWSPEVMNSYPSSLNAYPDNWIEDLNNLNDESLWRIDTGQSFDDIANQELKELFVRLKEISKFPTLKTSKLNFSPEDFFKMKDKKRHEIERIVSFLSEKKDISPRVLDIGGGIGHLARTLSKKMEKEGIIVEANSDFTRIGKQVNNKLNINNVSYINEYFKKDKSYHHNQSTMMTGLHACGDLTSDLIQYTVEKDLHDLLSLGCCYFKVRGEGYNFLSTSGKTLKLDIPKYALTLASRAHTGQKRADFDKKKKVKYYRYALHLFLFYELGIKDFLEVGESKFSLYSGSFSTYAKEKLNFLNISKNIKDKDLDDFYASQKTQDTIKRMFLANIVRWRFGRPIEKLIVLDRAIYLKESGYNIEVGEIFNENISPRNIAIFATEKLTNKK